MIGRAFLIDNGVNFNEAAETLEFEDTGHIVPNKKHLAKVVLRLTMVVSGSARSLIGTFCQVKLISYLYTE